LIILAMIPVLGATLCRPSTLLAVNCSSGRSINVSASTRVGLVGLPRSAWKLGRRSGKGRLENVRIFSTSDGTGWGGSSAQLEPLDLTEENVEQVLLDARSEVRTKLQFLSFLPPLLPVSTISSFYSGLGSYAGNVAQESSPILLLQSFL
jgi:hypothetical protein